MNCQNLFKKNRMHMCVLIPPIWYQIWPHYVNQSKKNKCANLNVGHLTVTVRIGHIFQCLSAEAKLIHLPLTNQLSSE